MAFSTSFKLLAAYALLTIAQCHAGVLNERQYGYGGGYGGAPAAPAASSSSAPIVIPSAVPSAVPSAAAQAAASLKGDKQCSSLMCISAAVNGSVTQYVMSSTGSKAVGWMAMGWGSSMAGSPMVIMWANADGSVTLSQRSSTGHTAPVVSANPPKVATSSLALSTLTGAQQAFAFTMDGTSQDKQSVVWAFGTSKPSSAAVDSSILQHLDAASFTLDLSKTLDATPSGTSGSASPTSSGGSNGGGSKEIPYKYYEKLIIAHAVMCTLGFLVLLPAGALLARYFRTVSSSWFKGHWIMQFLISGPVIIIGIFLGIGAVGAHGVFHLDDAHKKWGVAIFVLYFMQCFLGTFIHFIKPKINTGRPIQNYFHAVLGLLIIAFSFYQVRTGYKTEWPLMTGRDKLPGGADTVWYLWVVLVPFTYFVGLSLLPRQYRQEKESRATAARAQSKLIQMIGRPAEAYNYSNAAYNYNH